MPSSGSNGRPCDGIPILWYECSASRQKRLGNVNLRKPDTTRGTGALRNHGLDGESEQNVTMTGSTVGLALGLEMRGPGYCQKQMCEASNDVEKASQRPGGGKVAFSLVDAKAKHEALDS